jgi:hypothetical protein
VAAGFGFFLLAAGSQGDGSGSDDGQFVLQLHGDPCQKTVERIAQHGTFRAGLYDTRKT